MMAVQRFRGGVHPPDRKAQTASCAIERMPLTERLVVPMSQHLGAPCAPLVAKGDRVVRGQLIGQVDAMISAPIHAPASGEVVAVGPALTPAGVRATCVTIVPDADTSGDVKAIEVSGDGTGAIARAAGVVGLGGAAFPASVKLSPPKNSPIDVVIINGCECEPFLTCDHRVMLESPARVIAGARLIAEAVGATRTVLAVEDNKPDAAEALRAAAPSGVEVVMVHTRYPQGAEKQLIFAVTGRAVERGKLPSSAGCLVHNVQTAVAIADAVESGMPLIERVVTVSGAVARPGNYLVAIGTSIAALIEFAGGLTADASRVIAGGPMTGQPLGDLDVPVVKGTSGVVALTAAEAAPIVDGDQACIRCGRCVEVCPMVLHPYAIANYANVRHWNGCERFFALDCIECGCCSYVCPTRRPLLQLIRTGKGTLISKGVRV
ncbi:MAG: electron transport complex subunit RsxC [Coriobacteriia bacterium]|nr:electron transport complex subunit RsxC [Coriobacteriia bacterium]